MPRAPQPERGERLEWARWPIGVVGVILLAAGTFIRGGWPIVIVGFIVVVGAAALH